MTVQHLPCSQRGSFEGAKKCAWMMNRKAKISKTAEVHASPKRLAGGGLGTLAIVLIAMFFGIDPSAILQSGGDSQTSVQQQAPQNQQAGMRDEGREFVSRVLGSNERVWGEIFQKAGRQYAEPKLVLFTDKVQSACGFASAASGPFYCGNDQKVYIDLAFYRELRERFKAPGDFAQAYVIAHEVGHHVQNQLGIMGKVQARQQRASERDANDLSVRLELQADCLAGIWASLANRDRKILEHGDIEEGFERRRDDRRRYAAKALPRLRRPGRLHPWQLRTTGALVPQRIGDRRFEAVRYVCRTGRAVKLTLRNLRSVIPSGFH